MLRKLVGGAVWFMVIALTLDEWLRKHIRHRTVVVVLPSWIPPHGGES